MRNSKKSRFIFSILAIGVIFLGAQVSAQNLFELGDLTGPINEFSPDGTPSVYATGFSSILTAIASDAGGNLYALDDTGGNILKIAPGGSSTTIASGFEGLRGITLDAAGNIFVTTQDTDTTANVTEVLEIKSDGTRNVVASGFTQEAEGLAFNSAGDLFVASRFGHSITEIQTDGTQISIGSGLSLENALAFDASGNLYATSLNKVIEITPAGVQTTFATESGMLGGLAFDNFGNLFVGTAFGNIDEIAPDGTQTTFASGLGFPESLAFQGTVLPVPEPSVFALLFAGAGACLFYLKGRALRSKNPRA